MVGANDDDAPMTVWVPAAKRQCTRGTVQAMPNELRDNDHELFQLVAELDSQQVETLAHEMHRTAVRRAAKRAAWQFAKA